MDWLTLASALGVSSILQIVVTGWQNRKINKADYAQKIIDQAETRVTHALDDRDRAIKERDEAWADSKGQRKAKQEWRNKCLEEQRAHHKTQLELKDSLAKIAEAEWHRCEVNGCTKRIPPRKRDRVE